MVCVSIGALNDALRSTSASCVAIEPSFVVTLAKRIYTRNYFQDYLQHDVTMQAIECAGQVQFDNAMIIWHLFTKTSCCEDCSFASTWSASLPFIYDDGLPS